MNKLIKYESNNVTDTYIEAIILLRLAWFRFMVAIGLSFFIHEHNEAVKQLDDFRNDFLIKCIFGKEQ